MRQVLEEKPGSAVDLLETALLVKKTDFVAKESSPLVPISVSLHAAHVLNAASYLSISLQSAADAARAVATNALFG